MQLFGVDLRELVREEGDLSIYRGVTLVDSRSVVLKVAPISSRRRIAELRHEQRIAQRLSGHGTLPLWGLHSEADRIGLLLEDLGGLPLGQLTAGAAVGVGPFLQLARGICGALASLHAAGIVHKNLSPRSIWVHPERSTAWLLDLGIASVLAQEASVYRAGSELAGQLAYMAPEQTGRMNRSIDQRSDLYALGTVFFELLTGRLPFPTRDPIELVHCHIAQPPPSLATIDPSLPPVLSIVVSRLLCKDADDRYQTAQGLLLDLDSLLREFAQTGQLTESFTPGERDRQAVFRLPERQVGRTAELLALEQALARAAKGGLECVTLRGGSGTGKSSLVQELLRQVASRRGHYIAGKYDQYNRGAPFAVLLQTLASLVGYVLGCPESLVKTWQKRVVDALGSGLPVLAEAIPSVERIVGPQPKPVPAGSGAEAQNRLEQVLLTFLAVFARQGHPLVVFLDDLQWADSASLRLLASLATQTETAYLLLITGLREQADPIADSLRSTLQALESGRARAQTIELLPLQEEHVVELVAETLSEPKSVVADLAAELFRRTRGNPFFVREFLRLLHHRRLLWWNSSIGAWYWDLSAIDAAGVPESAVDLLLGEMRRLSRSAQALLQIAACLGTQLTTRQLAAASGQQEGAVLRGLWSAIERDIVVPLDASYRLLLDEEVTDPPDVALRFQHDRVRQAAYAMIEESELPTLRLQIGRRLLAQAEQKATVAEQVLEVVEHLNVGRALITDPSEQLHLSQLNLWAGQKAKRSAAYESATNFLEAGVELLGQAGVAGSAQAPQLAFELPFELAECTYLCGRFERAEAVLGSLESQTLPSMLRAQVCELKMSVLVSRGQAMTALHVGLQALLPLGVSFPEDDAARWQAAQVAHREVAQLLAGRTTETLLRAPELLDPDRHAALKILTAMLAPANLNQPALFSLVAATQARVSLVHGHADESAYGYVLYGMHLATGLNRQDEAAALGELGLLLNDQRGGTQLVCRLNFVIGSYSHFRKPIPEILAYLQRAFAAGQQSGDFIFLSYACSHMLLLRLSMGEPLDELAEETQRYLRLMERTRVTSSKAAQTVVLRVCEALRGRTRALTSLSGDGFDEAGFARELDRAKLSFPLNYHRSVRLLLLLHAGAFQEAAAFARSLGPAPSAAFYFVSDMVFHHALAAAASLNSPSELLPEHSAELTHLRGQLAEWASGCPATYQHKLLLIDAELARLHGDSHTALSLYDKALEHAATAGFVADQGLIAQRAATFHGACGHSRLARAYLRDAAEAYSRWGATAILRKLPAVTPTTLFPSVTGSAEPTANQPLHNVDAGRLELLSVIKAAQAFSAEVELGRLIDAIMRIVLENAGADRGVLLLERDGELRILKELPVGPVDSGPMSSTALSQSDRLPQQLVRYVHRSSDKVVLSDPTELAARCEPEYLLRHKPRSVLCLPIRQQGQPLGVLYLENSLTAGAFTADRVTVLHLLAAQVGTSLKNAVYYEQILAARDAAQAASQAKSAFLANMSHELRTPLNAIIGYSELLLEDAQDRGNDELASDLTRIQTAGRHLLELINSILDLSKIEAKRMEVRVERLQLRSVVDEAIAAVAPLVTKNHNRLEIDCPELLGTMETDKTKLRQILVNVLGNAAKFTTSGAVSLRVSRTPNVAEGAHSEVRFVVADTGVGMTEDQLARIFEAFHQADNSMTRKFGGTGLGLTITKKLCEMLGGTITATSQPGVGSVFTIALPASIPTATPTATPTAIPTAAVTVR